MGIYKHELFVISFVEHVDSDIGVKVGAFLLLLVCVFVLFLKGINPRNTMRTRKLGGYKNKLHFALAVK